MSYNLKGGVLIIGSLYWQDDKEKDSGDKIRKTWRDENLDMATSIDVEVPIRYGRFSSQNGKTYTMVFDNSLLPEQYGIAKCVSFLKPFTTFDEIKDAIAKLSEAEGDDKSFIKGNTAWCVCSVIFNPKRVNTSIKSSILKSWENELSTIQIGNKKFIKNPKEYSISKQGELEIPWPENIVDLDFMIATAILPKNRKGIEKVTPSEIAKFVANRNYFYPNHKAGIRTFQDEEIIKFTLIDK